MISFLMLWPVKWCYVLWLQRTHHAADRLVIRANQLVNYHAHVNTLLHDPDTVAGVRTQDDKCNTAAIKPLCLRCQKARDAACSARDVCSARRSTPYARAVPTSCSITSEWFWVLRCLALCTDPKRIIEMHHCIGASCRLRQPSLTMDVRHQSSVERRFQHLAMQPGCSKGGLPTETSADLIWTDQR